MSGKHHRVLCSVLSVVVFVRAAKSFDGWLPRLASND